MDKRQTAVEWLVEQLKIEEGINFIPTSLFNQAKAIEKEQIIDAYTEGKLDGYNYNYKDYYNETYGK